MEISDTRTRPEGRRFACEGACLAYFMLGWLWMSAGRLYLQSSGDAEAGARWLAPADRPKVCTLESSSLPPGAPGPRELGGLVGIGPTRALRLSQAMWLAGGRLSGAELDALPGFGEVLSGRVLESFELISDKEQGSSEAGESRFCDHADVHFLPHRPFAGRPCPRASLVAH